MQIIIPRVDKLIIKQMHLNEVVTYLSAFVIEDTQMTQQQNNKRTLKINTLIKMNHYPTVKILLLVL